MSQAPKRAYEENVFQQISGAGFKRKHVWVCHEGPHPNFKVLGKLSLRYSMGKKRWELASAIDYVMQGSKIDETYRVLTDKHNYHQAVEKAWKVIALLYTQYIQEKKEKPDE